MITINIVSVHDALRLLQHDMDFEPRKECQPTGAMPGTMERLEVYRLRIENGEDLFHPNDNQMATLDNRSEYIALLTASMDATKLKKREAARVQAENRTENRKKRNMYKQRSRARDQLVTTRIRVTSFAKHPDIIDSDSEIRL